MQSQVMRNHACPLQLIRLYFPGVGRDTREKRKAIKPSCKILNSALLTLTESLNASLYVYISPPLNGWHSSSNRYPKANKQQSFLSPDEGLTLEKSASLFLHIENLTLTLFQTGPKIWYTISNLPYSQFPLYFRPMLKAMFMYKTNKSFINCPASQSLSLAQWRRSVVFFKNVPKNKAFLFFSKNFLQFTQIRG